MCIRLPVDSYEFTALNDTLKVGDVVPIHVPEELHMLVEKTTFGIGAPGEANGNAALKIRSIARPRATTNR